MHHIVIISASVRTGRKSHRVALFFKNWIKEHVEASVEIVDLMKYKFPVFDERLKFQKNPSSKAIEFAEKINQADGIIIVTPEYNGGYPASLKNVIDLLYPEWKRKPIAIATVSAGAFGGAQVTTSLVLTLWKIGVWLVPSMFPAPNVQDNYDEAGNPQNREAVEKRASAFVNELMWCMEAKAKMASGSSI